MEKSSFFWNCLYLRENTSSNQFWRGRETTCKLNLEKWCDNSVGKVKHLLLKNNPVLRKNMYSYQLGYFILWKKKSVFAIIWWMHSICILTIACMGALSKHLLNSSSWGRVQCHGESVPCPLSSGEESFLNTHLPLPWQISIPFPQILSLSLESRAKRCPSAPLKRSCGLKAPLSLLYSGPNKPRDLGYSLFTLPSGSFTISIAILWAFSNSFMSYLLWSVHWNETHKWLASSLM